MRDILFLSWNRWEFTEVALRCLFQNTNWSLVDRLVVYDDGSEPGTVSKLATMLHEGPNVDTALRQTAFRSPPAVMVDYLKEPADEFVKIDNDIAVPPGWLEQLLQVWHDEIDLLGMEIGHPHGLHLGMGMDKLERGFHPARHIGGVGMMRASAFAGKPIKPSGRFGFTEWQHTHRPRRGWIFPEILAPCLDRVPVEPYVSLSTTYERLGWQRGWWKYPLGADRYWSWMEGV